MTTRRVVVWLIVVRSSYIVLPGAEDMRRLEGTMVVAIAMGIVWNETNNILWYDRELMIVFIGDGVGA